MTSPVAGPVALLVVPPGTHRPEPLAAALRHWHPELRILPVWAGDPHLRPVLTDGYTWWHSDGEATAERQLELVGRAPGDALWLRVAAAASSALAAGAARVLVLVVGRVAVIGRLDALSADTATATLVPRAFGAVTRDGLHPDETELLDRGSWVTDVMCLGGAARPMLEWLRDELRAGPVDGCLPRLIERVALGFGLDVCRDPAVGVGTFRWHTDAPALAHLPDFDAEQPWVLDPGCGGRARVDVVGHPDRTAAITAAIAQVSGRDRRLVVPGGMAIDDVIRDVVSSADGDVPAPWSEPAAFRAWIASRYWSALHASRRDLAAAFPEPLGGDTGRFRDWCRRSFVDGHTSAVLGVSEQPDQRWSKPRPLDPTGVNLVGYLTRELSLGDVARRLRTGLVAAGVEVASLPYQRTASPQIVGEDRTADPIAHQSTLAVVNADQFPALAMDHPELLAAGTHVVGYWFWELEHIPRQMRAAAAMVDEIWVGSQFVADAFAAAVDTPVRRVPIPVPRPVPSLRDRASFPELAPAGDRFVFAVVFDHFSVTERKNPVGAIEAFRRAFAPGEGPVLIVKSMNASSRWPQHQHVAAAAEGRDDIVLWDEHLDRADHMAFIACADALVSLHRSEGLGLHLAEAMWLGTPVIATRYSGNLDFMDDECSMLVDATLVPVVRGEGVYPPEARWADPDLDQAAAAMRALAGDPSLVSALAAAGLARMEVQPSLADTGRVVAGLLGIEVAS